MPKCNNVFKILIQHLKSWEIIYDYISKIIREPNLGIYMMQSEMNANLFGHLYCKILDQTHMTELMRENETI